MAVRDSATTYFGPSQLDDRIETFEAAGEAVGTFLRQVDPNLRFAQRSQLRTRITLSGYTQAQDPNDSLGATENFVVVDLKGSLVNPGTPVWDQKDKYGFYTHSVRVRMWFDDASGFRHYDDVPQSTGRQVSDGNSSGRSAGAMGLSGMLTFESGESASRSFQDFEVVNNTALADPTGPASDSVSDITWILRVNSDGHADTAAYQSPFDLVDPSLGGTVMRPTERARTELPFAPAAVFQDRHPRSGAAPDVLNVEVAYKMMAVEKTALITPQWGENARLSFAEWDEAKNATQSKIISAWVIRVDATPVVHTFKYRASIDFDNKHVVLL